MKWVQVPCHREIHGDGGAGDVLLRPAGGDYSAWRGQAQCVYLDPPFMTGDDFFLRMRVGEQGWATGKNALLLPAYRDKFPSREAYLSMLRKALQNAQDLLTDSGSLFLHLDSRAGAHARLLCDDIFGESNFVNEIIWAYQSGGRSMRHFPRKHDVILFYRKSREHFFDLSAVPIPRKENRQNHMRRRVDENGRTFRTIQSGGKTYTYYDDDPVYPDDVWTDVSHLQQKDPQRTGYDTQKPLALLQRIIRCSTRPGDLVADLFAGSGTTAVAAAQLGRRFLAGDVSPLSLGVCRKRLLDHPFSLAADTAAPGASLQAEVESGIAFIDVALGDYAPPPAGDEAVSGLDAVDQWSVGFYEDGVFRAQASAARRKHTPALTPLLQLPRLRGVPAVLIVDVYGHRSVWIQEV